MIDIKVVTLSSLLIIFTSVFFIHYAFNNFISLTEYCAVEGGDLCLPTNLLLLFLFSFSFVIAFILVIETTIYFMFKGLEMLAHMSEARENKLKSAIASLEKKKSEIVDAKKAAQKKYFNRQVEEETFKKLKQKYNTEILEIEIKLTELKKQLLKVW